jgi:hypothetical protein
MGNPAQAFRDQLSDRRNGADYLAVKALYLAALGGLHTFTFRDWVDAVEVRVRFDSPLTVTGLDVNHDHIETLTLTEVRE